MAENKKPASPTNTERLRAHLSKNGLAAALLSAWEAKEPANVQDRLLAALMKFYFPEKTTDGEAEAE